MPKSVSLHIGLNSVDPNHYQGWDGALSACEFDANDMEAIAKAVDVKQRQKLLTAEATSDAEKAWAEYYEQYGDGTTTPEASADAGEQPVDGDSSDEQPVDVDSSDEQPDDGAAE